MELNKRIRAMRKDLNMSQDELAKKVGYTSRSTITKIESGENDIPQSKIKDFAKALKTTPAILMGWSEYDKQHKHELDQFKEQFKFEDYLKSLGYEIKIEKIKSKKPTFDENLDKDGKFKSFRMKFEESFEITIIKDNVISIYSQDEFDQLKNTSSQMLNAEIYKNSLKNYVSETIAAHRTDDCTQAIDESTLTNSVQRLKNQAFEKHGVKYK